MYIPWLLLRPLTSLSVFADTEDTAAVVVVVAVVVTVVVISACTMQAYRRVPAADKDWCSGKCYLLCSRIKLWKNDQLSSIKTTGL